MDKKIKHFDKWLRLNIDSRGAEFLAAFLKDNNHLKSIVDGYFEKQREYNRSCLLKTIKKNNEIYDIVLAGNIGRAASRYMLEHYTDELKNVFPQWVLERKSDFGPGLSDIIISYLKDGCVKGAEDVIYVGEGGLNRALFNLWEYDCCGFEIQYDRIAVDQITVELCEYYDLDPLDLLSGDCFIIITRHGGRLCDYIEGITRQRGIGINCSIIGRLIGSKDKLFIHKEETGKMMRPVMDGLLQLLQR